MMRSIVALAALALSTAAASAATTVLYNGALGTAPESQGYLETTTLGVGTETVGSTSTTFDTTALNFTYGGFSNYTADPVSPVLVNPSFPILNAASGFSVDFTLKDLAESHASNDRSGVSLIALSSDHTGVELGFWTNTIFAQSATFTHAEDVAYNTTANTNYHLAFLGSTYTLSANGSAILSGTMRDYSMRGVPYSVPNYLFLGDDTTSAAGSFNFSSLSVSVPEPASMIAISASLFGLLKRTRRA